MRPLAADAWRRGWAAWNIEYRRVGAGGGWPTTFTDVAAAVDHLAGLADRHRLDLGRVVAAGHSAGGHLALWLATRPGLPAGAPGAAPRVAVSAAVSQAGLADLRAAEGAGLGEGAVAALLAGSSGAVPDRYDLASPIERLPVGVPTLCVHGREDPTVPVSQSEAWVAAARAAGDEAELVVFAGGHHDVLDPGHESWHAIAERVLS
jgi:acetyl esterase/lipase